MNTEDIYDYHSCPAVTKMFCTLANNHIHYCPKSCRALVHHQIETRWCKKKIVRYMFLPYLAYYLPLKQIQMIVSNTKIFQHKHKEKIHKTNEPALSL